MCDPHEPIHEIRDAVYGFAKLSKAERSVIDCPEFQRLRDIRQLAMAHLVYPGANHTRFEHSIGCVHLATLMFDALIEDRRDRDILRTEFKLDREARERARKVLRLAALLHDVGHPPFSHSSEALLPKDTDQSEKPVPCNHEVMSARIIRETKIGETIEKGYGHFDIGVEEVIAIATDFSCAKGFQPHLYHEFLNKLLTGELGADRIDYLLRDAHHSGQSAGGFDYRRLIGSLTMVKPPKEDERGSKVGFDDGGWLVAEQMIVARYLMYQSLYFHKTNRIYEKHLEKFMRDWVKRELKMDTFPSKLEDYIALSDSRILASISGAARDKNQPGHEHARHFIDRSHFRLAKEIILRDNSNLDRRDRRVPDKKRFAQLAKAVSTQFGEVSMCDEPDHSATAIFGDTSKILIRLDGEPRYLDDISEIVRGMSEKIWRGRVYAEEAKRKEVRKFCKDWLNEHPARQGDDNHGGESAESGGVGRSGSS